MYCIVTILHIAEWQIWIMKIRTKCIRSLLSQEMVQTSPLPTDHNEYEKLQFYVFDHVMDDIVEAHATVYT